MREKSDDPQKMMDEALEMMSDIQIDSEDKSRFKGNESVELDDSTISNLDFIDNDSSAPITHSEVDTKQLTDVYSSVRSSSDRRHQGYNGLDILVALDNEVSPGMVTGACEGTLEDRYENFRAAGLSYPEDEVEKLTAEGELFVEGASNLMESMNRNIEVKQDRQWYGEIINMLSKRRKNDGNRLKAFLMINDNSIGEVADSVDTTSRTIYNWMSDWKGENDSPAAYRGDPNNIEITPLGREIHNMVSDHHNYFSIANEFRQELKKQTEKSPVDYNIVGGSSYMRAEQ